jgi:MoaA/NifB/PqqE/SkfB family radical SAM enzyme
VPFVTLAGGEPLLVAHWAEVAQVLADAGCHVAVATNGSRLADAAEDLVRVGVRSVTISVDDVAADRHDDARRRPGLSAAIAKGLERLRAVDPARRIVVRVRMVLTPRNFRQMTELVEAWRDAVEEVSFQPVEDSGPDHIHHFAADAFAGFRPDDEADFERELARLVARFPEFDAPYYRRMPRFLFRHRESRQDFHCLLPAVGMKVRADGQAITCAAGARTLGSLVEQPLAAVWNAEPICTLRRESRNRERACYCWVQPTQINYRAPEPVRRLLLRAVGGGAPQ